MISPHGIVNGVSFVPSGLPGGSIAQGSLFAIYGAHLAPATPSPALSFPLGTSLNGVSVKVIQGATTVNALPVYVSPGQINAVMPSNAPLGRASIRVTSGNVQGPPSPVTITASSLGLIAANSGGFGPGVMQNFVSTTPLPLNTPAAPAKPGQTIILYGTGLGPISAPDNLAPPQVDVTTTSQVEVFVGGVMVKPGYSGRSSCCSGLDQVNFVVPANAPLGCWVPLQVRTGGTTMSNTVTMAISSDGSACSDPLNALSQPYRAGSKIGVVTLLHDDTTENVGYPSSRSVITDSAMVTFQKETPESPNFPFGAFHPMFSLPPAGSCTAYATVGDLFDGDPFLGAATSGKFLDGGTPLTVTGGSGPKTVARPADNSRNFQPLGYTYTGSLVPSSLFLAPGNYSVHGPGGADVGAFTANLTIPTPVGLTWTNRDQTSIISRSQGFTVNWTGAPADQPVIVFGGGVDLPSNATSLFVCVAPPGASSFTVPSTALGNIAPTRSNLLQSKGAVYVGALPISSPTAFSASGLDVGAALAGGFSGKTVIFQ